MPSSSTVRTPTIARHSPPIAPAGQAEIARRSRPALALLVLLAAAPTRAQDPVPGDAAPLLDRFEAIRAAEAAALDAIAGDLDAENAAAVRALIEPPPPADGPRRFVPLPEVAPAADAPAAEAIDGVAAARDEAVRSYAALAESAFEAGRLAIADAGLRAVLARDPDHAEARRLLGYVPHEGGWATPYALLELRQGKVRHPTYGWVWEEWVPHLEAGELPAPGAIGRDGVRWMPAAEADALRQRRIEDGWIVETPHFKIRADVPLADAIAFGRRLEDFRDLFTSVMADVIGPQYLQLAQLHRDPDAVAPASSKKQLVNYFGTKQQYVDALSPTEGPDIANSLGIYLDPVRSARLRRPPMSYFYEDPDGDLAVEATQYHEVSHQLLFELSGPSRYDRNVGQFWVFEGLGTYFETVEPQADGTILYGGPVGLRFAAARIWIVEHGEFVPIDELLRDDRGHLIGEKGDTNPSLNYCESMALTVLLMDGDGGSHRPDFLDYAADAYRGRVRGPDRSLPAHVGIDAEALGDRLRSFLERQPPTATGE